VIGVRRELRELISLAGGKVAHPVFGLPGGVSRALGKADQERFVKVTERAVKFGEFQPGGLQRPGPQESPVRRVDPLGCLHPQDVLHGPRGQAKQGQLFTTAT